MDYDDMAREAEKQANDGLTPEGRAYRERMMKLVGKPAELAAELTRQTVEASRVSWESSHRRPK